MSTRPTPAQLAAQLAAFEQSLRAGHKGKLFATDLATNNYPTSQALAVARRATLEWANLLIDSEFIILDIETTGLDTESEIIELALLTETGEILFNSLIQPTTPIQTDAYAANHITRAQLNNAPTWKAVYTHIQTLLAQAPRIVFYHQDFVIRLLTQTCERYQLPSLLPTNIPLENLMNYYAAYHGEWSTVLQRWEWQSLIHATQQLELDISPDLHPHRAYADCVAILAVIKALAEKAKTER